MPPTPVRFPDLDLEKTAPFVLGQGDDAVLLIHGFTGSPWDMRPLGEALAARCFRVEGIRLPGHGTNPEAMSTVGQRDWELAAQDALLKLDARRVFVAGLSMGALLGLWLAARFPAKVQGLGLIAPAYRFSGAKMAALRAFRHTRLLERVLPWITKDSTDLEDAAALAEAPIMAAFPSARLNDLFRLQDTVEREVPHVECPMLIAVAKHDHVVSPRSGDFIARHAKKSSQVRYIELTEGFHIVPRDRSGELLADELASFFERVDVGPAKR